MLNQVELAYKDLQVLNSLLANLLTTSSEIVSFNNSMDVVNQIDSLSRRVFSDKTLTNFVKMANDPGMEALASELAIRSKSKILGFKKEATELMSSASQLKNQRITKHFTGMGFSLTDIFSSSSVLDDRANGLILMQAFYDKAQSFQIPYASFDAYLTDAEKKVPEFAANLGELVRINSLSTDMTSAVTRMQDLAVKSKGLASLSAQVMAAGGTGDTVNWSELLPSVAGDVASTGLNVLENVGHGVLGTLNLVKYLPWILGGAAILYFVISKKTEQVLTQANPRKRRRKRER